MIRIVVIKLSILAAVLSPVHAVGQEPTKLGEPRSATAKAAAAVYSNELKKIEAEAAAARTKLRDQYAQQLDEARKQALTKDDLDEAQRIVATKQALMKEPPKNGFGNAPIVKTDFQLHHALFGAEGGWANVTDTVQKFVKGNKLTIALDTATFGHLPDPAFGKHKDVIVVYSIGGQVHVGIVGPPDWRAEFPEQPKKK